jgi:hypothetical protein
VVGSLWGATASNTALQDIVPFPALSAAQKRELKNYEFVSLAYFLPLPNSYGVAPLEHSKESALAALLDAHTLSDPAANTQVGPS